MALLLVEGFDHDVSSWASKGWINTGSPTSTGGGRTDRGMQFSNNTSLQKAVAASSTVITGFAFRFPTAPSSTAVNILQWKDESATNIPASLRLNSAGTLSVYDNGGLLATTSVALSVNTWYYIEFGVVVGTSGTATVRIDGGMQIDAVTGNFGTANVGYISIGRHDSNTMGSPIYDDIYVVNTSGAGPANTYLGDCVVQTVRPVLDGTYTEWTPNTGSTHYSRVNDQADPNVSTYVGSSTVGQRDSFRIPNINAGTVYGLAFTHNASKSDTGAREIAGLVRHGGSDYVGTSHTLVSGTFNHYTELYEKDPTGSQWTNSSVTAAEFGVKVTL
jgi:hypothetical protein